MNQTDYNSGNENKRMRTNNRPEILQNMDTWIYEIDQNNLDNLDNYISSTFALLRDKRLYGNASKYGVSTSDMNDLIQKIEATNNIIKNNNYEIQIQQKENIAKLGAIIKGLSNGTFRGGLKHRKRTLKKGSRHRRSRGNRRARGTRYSKKRRTRHRVF